MKPRSIVLLLAAAVPLAGLASAGAAGKRPAQAGTAQRAASATAAGVKTDGVRARRYVVVMQQRPLVTTYGRTKVRSKAAIAGAAALVRGQDAALAAVGLRPSAKTHTYTTSLNGFAVRLTDNQAAKLAADPSVMLVLPDVMRYKTTDASPRFLGLSGRGGVWASGYDGRGMVVGVIDSGIWPEHPSFADDGTFPAPKVTLEDTPANPSCNFGNVAANPHDAPFTCNDKLIGARDMLSTYRAVLGAAPDEFQSARDDDGHGTHTASTAAGDRDVAARIFGVPVGRISGIAPRAQVIAYKALGNEGGFTSDLAAAIDQAVADGVDAINYSVGGGPNLVTADTVSFLFAADAGVAVAVSAGNDGPDPATIGGPADVPWVTSVGASTQPRFFQGTVTLGNGRRLRGATVTRPLRSRPLVDAEAAGSATCVEGKLDPAKVAGAIVLCLRGGNGRVAKSHAVLTAGGAGMILYNTTDVDNLFTDNFFVPTVMVDNTPGVAIKRYIASSRHPRASLSPEGKTWLRYAPSMAIFSSRGPDPTAPDIIKPDVTAPGVQILAGNTPFPTPGEEVDGELFQAIAGTSMSSPHVAGALTLIKQAHPDWSPAMIKSALMTTAYQQVRDNDRVSRATPFAMGSGHIDLAGQYDRGTPFDPGLVYDAGFADYLGFLCDADRSIFANADATCARLAAAGVPVSATDLNYPSIGVSALPGTTTVTRTVTSVQRSSRPLEFRARVDAPAGYSVTVSPSRLRLKPGDTATYTVTITNTGAPNGAWRFGSLTWHAHGYDVRSPIAVRGTPLATPASVAGSGVDGTASIPVKFGYTGPYTATAHGLVPATETTGTVQQDPDQTFDPTDGYSTAVPITVSGAVHLRIALPPSGVADPSATDLDIYLADPSGAIVAQSTAGGTDEQIDVPDPVDGTWTLWVHGWQTGGGGSASFTLEDWVVPSASGGSLTVTAAPTSATSGTAGSVDVAWTGATGWNLGAVSHADASGTIETTLVEVDNR